MKLKSIIAAAIIAAPTMAAANQKDGMKVAYCSLLGQNASNYAIGRMIGITEQHMTTKAIDPLQNGETKNALYQIIHVVYAVDDNTFFGMKDYAPTAFRNAAVKTCMTVGF